MNDRDKVISRLQIIRTWAEVGKNYNGIQGEGCLRDVVDWIDDALVLLKEQEPREWIYCEDDSGQDGYRCPKCGFFEPWYYNYTDHDFIKKYQFCPSCGAKMKERTK